MCKEGKFDCNIPFKEYIKVFISGTLTALLISSIYSFLTNTSSIRVLPDGARPAELYSDFWDDAQVVHGITCFAYNWNDTDYCNNITQIMADAANPFNRSLRQSSLDDIRDILDISTTTIPQPVLEWQCSAHTKFRSKHEKLSDSFSSFHMYLHNLFAFTALYAYFSIVHDWTLIKYKKNLDVVSFLPRSNDDLYFYGCLENILNPVRNLRENGNCIIRVCTFFLFFIIMIPVSFLVVLDMVFSLTLYPLIHYMVYMFTCCRWKPKHYQIFLPFGYVSAAWVGLTRFWMSLSTALLLGATSDGFSFEIPAVDEDRCFCECNYVFHEWDYYKLLITTSIFILLSIKFLWSWTNETIHGQYFLYLANYSLPIKYADKINPEECTGSMMRDIEMTQFPVRVRSHSEYELMDYHKDTDSNLSVTDVKNPMAGFQCRLILFVLMVFAYLGIGSYVLYETLSINYYGYPSWVQKEAGTFAWIGVGLTLVAYIGIAVAASKYAKNKMRGWQDDDSV